MPVNKIDGDCKQQQGHLLLRDQKRTVSTEVIVSQPTFKDVLKLCKSISGLNDQQLCNELDIDPAQWSRIWSSTGHFPENKLLQYMRICENIAPVIWIAHMLGYELHPLKSTLELELEKEKSEKEELKKKLEYFEELIIKVKK